MDALTVLGSDRFQGKNSKLIVIASQLSEILSKTSVPDSSLARVCSNLTKLLNCLLYCDQEGDSIPVEYLTEDRVKQVLLEGIEVFPPFFEYDYFTVVKSLKDKALFGVTLESSGEDEEVDPLLKLVNYDGSEKDASAASRMKSEPFSKSKRRSKPQGLHKTLPNRRNPSNTPKSSHRSVFDVNDTEYWVYSVSLERPLYPHPNYANKLLSFTDGGQEYCIYEEAILPYTQSHISCFTDVNRFKDSDVKKLFPPIHLYTRSPSMYKEYPGLDYDPELGTVIPIPGYSIDELIQNLIEYPHFDIPDRIVTISGKETIIPFWQHIEIDGEMHKTTSVWGEFPGTEKLPKTEAFMNEFVVRRYILDTINSKQDFKHIMRGTLGKFLTLYDVPEYYEKKGYDPIEIGRTCIESRRSYKYTRNPVIRKYDLLHK